MSLPVAGMLAVRYLRSARRDAYVTFLSVLAGGGIALGVAALVLVLAALTGLQSFLREDVLARTPHMEIELPDDAAASALAEQLSAVDGVVEVRRLLRGRGWVLPGSGSWLNAEIVGYEGGVPSFFEQDAEQAESTLPSGILVPESLLFRYGLQRGSLVELASPKPTLTPLGPKPRLHQVRIGGVYAAGATEQDETRIGVPFELARKMFGARRQRLEVRATSLERAVALAPAIRSKLPNGADLRTWKDLNRGLFFALQLEKRLMFLSIFLIVPIAAMALVTVLALLVSAKRGEIGMLHALGATPRQVERAFFGLGGLLAVVGLTLGLVVGVAGAVLCDRFRLITPGDVYFVSHVPFRIDAGDLTGVVVATLVFTLGSAWIAARRASAFRPVDALRNP